MSFLLIDISECFTEVKLSVHNNKNSNLPQNLLSSTAAAIFFWTK